MFHRRRQQQVLPAPSLSRPRLALAELLLLWLAIIVTIQSFRVIDRRASLLFLPYFAWTSFAFELNVSIVRQNPELG